MCMAGSFTETYICYNQAGYGGTDTISELSSYLGNCPVLDMAYMSSSGEIEIA